MPNYVCNKIIFDSQFYDKVINFCIPNEHFDFRTLIPIPLNVYLGNVSLSDEKDFPLNWYSWNKENWGTKWNSSDSSYMIENDKGIICFKTAWSQPYPIIVAFANKFIIPFQYLYSHEYSDRWTVEEWDIEGKICKRINHSTKKGEKYE